MNVQELLQGTFARLRYVRRWNTQRVAHPESVAEHSFYVSLYALFVCEWLSERRQHTDGITVSACYEAVGKALCHDLEEARTGDMPRDFKKSDSRLESILETTAQIAMTQSLDKLELAQGTSFVIEHWWKHSHDKDISGCIVAFADFLSVLSFLLQEKQDSNRSILRHVVGMQLYFEEFEHTQYDFIRELVTQTNPLVKDLSYELPQ